MDPRYGTPPTPRFPLFKPPYCRRCRASCTKITGQSRYYYVCELCDSFCTFDDEKGISYKNPICQCGFYSRQVEKQDGGTFIACAIGVCKINNSSPARHISSINGPSSVSALAAQVTNNNIIDGEFVRLLDHVLSVVKDARLSERIVGSISDLERGFSALSVEGSGNPAPDRFKMRSATEFERHSKVGAAGELFVYQLLMQEIQHSGKIQWESNMRNVVKQHHPDFFKWPEWSGAETTDIILHDERSILTESLIIHGYLDRSRWSGKSPKYMIEVKATMGDRTEFYMSDFQYKQMKRFSTTPVTSTQVPTIYVIARVSNLQGSDIKLRLYVDPCNGGSNLNFKMVWAVEE